MLVVANVSALAVGVLVYELARREGRDRDAGARRAVWIVVPRADGVRARDGLRRGARFMTATLVALLALRAPSLVDRGACGRGRRD